MFKHLYQNPPAAIAFAEGNQVSDEDLKEALKHFEQFYEEIFLELSNFGELKDLSVVDNLGDHLIGNVYAKFNDEESASKAFNALAGKYYHSDLVDEEYCPFINIKDCKCRKYEDGLCQRGAFCNFLHIKEVNKSLLRSLKDEMYEVHPEYKKNRTNNNNKKKKQRNHENTSSESSLDRYDNFTRKRIIQRWNDDAIAEKKIQDRRKRFDQAKIDLAIIEKKLKKKKYDEDSREKYYKYEKKSYQKDSKEKSYQDEEKYYQKDSKEKYYKNDEKSYQKDSKEKYEQKDSKEKKYEDSDDEETISNGENNK